MLLDYLLKIKLLQNLNFGTTLEDNLKWKAHKVKFFQLMKSFSEDLTMLKPSV